MNWLDIVRWGIGNVDQIQPLISDVQSFLAVPVSPAAAKVEASFPIQLRLAAIYDSLPAERQASVAAGEMTAMNLDALNAAEAEFTAQGLADRLEQLRKAYELIKPWIPVIIGIITKV